jgi:hypothetical protein
MPDPGRDREPQHTGRDITREDQNVDRDCKTGSSVLHDQGWPVRIFAAVNNPREDKMVAMNEPLWLDWNASVTCIPAMSLADLEKAGKDMKKLAKERS